MVTRVKCFSHTHLSNESLRSEIKNDPAREGEVTAVSLSRLAEYDSRKLYLPDGFPSMLAYCMGELWLSEGEAKKRIRVARAGRQCPHVFEALAEGRVNLSGLVCLAAHLTPETAEELLVAASIRRGSRSSASSLSASRAPTSRRASKRSLRRRLHLRLQRGPRGPLMALSFWGPTMRRSPRYVPPAGAK
jgi:hypothetical protein